MDIESAVHFLDELSNDSIVNSNDVVSVEPTIDIPITADENNSIQDKCSSESVDLVQIEVYQIESIDKDSEINLATGDDQDLSDVLGFNPHLFNL
ncbi:MAG: hypothetical protein AB2693_14125, partial [Candidatus Thiodiazotropha sp.]